MSLPLHAAGAYLLVASTPGIRAVSLVTKSDLVLVQKVERDRTLFFAAGRADGAGRRPGTQIIVRESYSEPNKKGGSTPARCGRARVYRAGTAQSLFCPFSARPIAPISRSPRSPGVARVVRWTSQSGCRAISDDNQGRFKTYGTTDRAVYRPQQTVQFREVVLERRPKRAEACRGQVHPRPGVRCPGAGVSTPHCSAPSEFGSVSGHFSLPADAPLGEYAVRCSRVQGGDGRHGQRRQPVPRRGVQEARVPGDRRAGSGARAVGTAGERPDRRQVLLRRASREREK